MIELKGISKNFPTRNVLDNINLKLENSRVYGLFGPNGTGKTTLLKIMSGYLKQTRGEYLIDGEPFTYKDKDFITFISDREIFYSWMKVEDAIKYYKDFFADFNEEKCRELVSNMELREKDRINVLSKGMKARLKVALSISRAAKIYLLDEPLGGLDPVSRKIILSNIKNLMNQDGTLIITSHLVNDVAGIIDHVLFLSGGRIIKDVPKDSLDLETKKLEDHYLEAY